MSRYSHSYFTLYDEAVWQQKQQEKRSADLRSELRDQLHKLSRHYVLDSASDDAIAELLKDVQYFFEKLPD